MTRLKILLSLNDWYAIPVKDFTLTDNDYLAPLAQPDYFIKMDPRLPEGFRCRC
jgi:hypothetical protein